MHACTGFAGQGGLTRRQRSQVHQLLLPGAVDALVAEGPQRALEARLVLGRHADASKAQAFAHLA